MAALTPMMQQYMAIKEQYKDCILFYRLGDFYEMFYDDALTASRELEITLTGKNCGQEERAPMCGVPYHAVDVYLNKLVAKGYKVAICEQVEDPKLTKKLVKRDVIQIITPGANIDSNSIENSYIASLSLYDYIAVISYCSLQTGDSYVINVENKKEKILQSLLMFDCKELVVSTSTDAALLLYIKNNSNVFISYFNDCTVSLQNENLFVNINDDRQISTFSRLYNYLLTLEKRELPYFKPVVLATDSKVMKLDYQAISNMELFKTLDNMSENENLNFKSKSAGLIENLSNRVCSKCTRSRTCWERDFNVTYNSFA